MREVVVAESLLSLVMPPDRAAATAGDLLEGSHGPFAFWLAVIQTALAAALRGISVLLVIKSAVLNVALNLTTLLVLGNIVARLALFRQSQWIGRESFTLVALFMPLLAGFLMARWLRGQEIAAWISIALLRLAAAIYMWLSPLQLDLMQAAVLPLFSSVSLLIGLALARRATVRRLAESIP